MLRVSLLALVVLAAQPATPTPTPTSTSTSTATPIAPAPAPVERVPPIAPELVPAVARPGDAVLVRVPLAPAAPLPSGTLAGRPLAFWRAGAEGWALAALPLETPPGPVPLQLGEPLAAAATLQVVEPGFPSRTLTVAPKFVEPPPSVRKRMEADRKAFAAAWDRPFSPPLFGAPFRWPRPERFGGRFGDQRVFNGKKESVHYGLDIDAPRGAPVHAANDGVVVLARNAYLSGKSVAVWHGADVFTVYFHMERLAVKPGAKVRQGDTLGFVGSTGRSTGPHLHFSVKVAGLYVDPESLVGIDFAAGSAPPRRAGLPAPAEAAPAQPEPAAAAATDAAPTR